jgi:hypothetical protein
MLYAAFESLLDAKIYRKNHGGWIFLCDNGESFWFSLDFTPQRIFIHRLTKGMNGRLI